MNQLDMVQVIWFSGYYNLGEGFKTDTVTILNVKLKQFEYYTKITKE